MLELEEYMWRYEQGHTLQKFGLPQPTARSSQRGNRALDRHCTRLRRYGGTEIGWTPVTLKPVSSADG